MENEHGVPELMFESIQAYRDHRLRPGGCLVAILSNDLVGAFSRADSETLGSMRAIVIYLSGYLPVGAWGSADKVDEWLRGGPRA